MRNLAKRCLGMKRRAEASPHIGKKNDRKWHLKTRKCDQIWQKKYEKHLIKWTSMNQWSIVLTCSSFETPSCPLTNRLGIGKAPWEFSVIRVLPTVAALLGLKESMQKRMLWTGESTYFLNKLLCLPRKKQKKLIILQAGADVIGSPLKK